MTENQRLKFIMDDLKFKSQAAFAKALSITPGGLSDVLRSKNGIGVSDKIKRMLEHSYDINIHWLETGEGNIYKTETVGNSGSNDDKNFNEDANSKGIPMYNAPGAGGGVEIYTDPNSDKIVGHLNFPGITKGSFALPVYGHSMYPTLENGVWVVLRPIENKHSINWGEVYYIEYGDYRVFKRLLISDNIDEVTLWSDNQLDLINDKPKFSPIIIKKTDIRKLCLVTDIYKKSNN